MFNFLFGSELLSKTITIAACLIAAYLFLYFFAQFKPVQSLFYGIVFLALIVSAVISFGNLNVYYASKGGVIGEITSIFEKNKVEIIEEENELKFDFRNVVLMKNANGKYSASMTSETLLKLDASEDYFIYVNNEPCTTVSCEERDIYATYSYAFMNREDGEYKVLSDDVMTFYFALYDNYSYLYIEVENGDITSGLWNAYFNKNDFKVRIVKVDSSFYNKAEYKNVRLFSKDFEIIKTIKIKENTNYITPHIEYNGVNYKFWKNTNNEIIFDPILVTKNIDLYGIDYIPVDLRNTSYESSVDDWLNNSYPGEFNFNISLRSETLYSYIRENNYSKIEITFYVNMLSKELGNDLGTFGIDHNVGQEITFTIIGNTVTCNSEIKTKYSSDDLNTTISVENNFNSLKLMSNGGANYSISGKFNVINYLSEFQNLYPDKNLDHNIYTGLYEIISLSSIKVYE